MEKRERGRKGGEDRDKEEEGKERESGEREGGGGKKGERRERGRIFFHRLSENILSLQFFLVFAELKTERRGKARRAGCAFAAAEFGSL